MFCVFGPPNTPGLAGVGGRQIARFNAATRRPDRLNPRVLSRTPPGDHDHPGCTIPLPLLEVLAEWVW
jgi:hypothetical protein